MPSSSMRLDSVSVNAAGEAFPAMSETKNDSDRVVAVVDAFSTGELLAQKLKNQGFKVVLVYSQVKQEEGVFSNSIDFADAEIEHNGSIAETAAKLRGLCVECVMAGAESGVLVADELMERMQLVGRNPLDLSMARRSKFLQQEVVRASGVRAAAQVLATEWQQVEDFIADWNPCPFKVIVKPNASAGSDDVFLCTSIEETKAAFNCINGAINLCGEANEGVLVMEFLQGQEYVVDSVSRDGERKVVAIWKYDKRKANGQFNVYFGMELQPVETELEFELVEYSRAVLDALQINNGPAHMEIIITATGPCLVEVGARCHGGHGTWATIADAAFGYNQMECTIDSYLHPERFADLPLYPFAPKAFGKEVFLVNYRDGLVRDTPGADRIKAMQSFKSIDMGVKEGSRLHKTIDLFTMPGRAQLLHEDRDQVERDYLKIHLMLEEGQMFELVAGKELEARPEGPAEE